MNYPTTYEKLMAEKLQQLTVPDMTDAIWARIEQQLDVEMPVDKSDTGNNSIPGFQFPGNTLLYIFLATLAGVLIYMTKSSVNTDVSTVPIINTVSVPSTADRKLRTNRMQEDRKEQPVFVDKADIPVNTKNTNPTAIEDQPVTISPLTEKKEEVAEIKPLPVSGIPEYKKNMSPAYDSTSKKSRGVKGISSNDYRIVPVRKDSL